MKQAVQDTFYQWLWPGLVLLLTFSCATPEVGQESENLRFSQSHNALVASLPNLPNDALPLKLVRIPAGEFMMGSPENEWGREPNEGPQHKVVLTQAFYMAQHELTQAQWMALMPDNPSTIIGPNLPVNRVSWHDAQTYLNKLTRWAGQGRFRLPTEAEWEYAARAGTQTATFFGDNPDIETINQYAWFRRNSNGEIHPVGQKQPNPWGLFDIHGNVWEWTADWYGPYFPEPHTDPEGPKLGSEKVFRGASWMARREYIRAADRGKFSSDNRRNTGGIRVVWSES